MYLNPAGLEDDREFFGRFLRMDITPQTWENITKSFTRVGDYLQSDNVKKRRSRADQARINGANGGRPEKPKNPENKTQETQTNNPNNPASERKGKVKGKDNITEPPVKGGEGIYNGVNHKTPSTTPQPLWRVGLRDGLVLHEVWEKYGQFLREKLPGMKGRERLKNAWLNYWPRDLGERSEEVKKMLSESDEPALKRMLETVAGNLVSVGKLKASVNSLTPFEDPIFHIKALSIEINTTQEDETE